VLVVRETTLSEIAPMFHAVLYVKNPGTTLKRAQKQEGAVFVTAETTTLETVL